ncbi:manganese efflux pump [Heyndrickxia ginsengihumi]|uniref:manganese efflux pump MntP n=1 Tax=Heyndrickxia ginsengihumi TaxID=363870 RepID=UPI003D22AC5B
MAVISETITLMVMAFALGMDAFSVSLGIGMSKLRMKQMFYIGLTVGIFHVIMPFFGIIAGKFLSHTFGMIAQYVGGILLIILGIQMMAFVFKKEETSIIKPEGLGLIFFALSVSLDSFSAGLSLGIYGARTIVVVVCFGIVATILAWLGLLIGRKVHGLLGMYGEVLGGMILFIFGVKLLLPF